MYARVLSARYSNPLLKHFKSCPRDEALILLLSLTHHKPEILGVDVVAADHIVQLLKMVYDTFCGARNHTSAIGGIQQHGDGI
jgi:hypothetical protein